VKTQKFLKILSKNKVWTTIIPSLNLWLFYVIVCLVLWGVFDFVVAGLFFAFGIILGWAQKKEVKNAFCEWWNSLPLLKFHTVSALIQLGVLVFLLNFAKPIIFTTNKITKKHGRRE
jgi:hypothetical protein